MKYLKMPGLAAVAAMAMTAFTAGTASATTLEVGGATKSESVELTMNLTPESSLLYQPTGGGSLANTCETSHVEGHTESPYSGHEVGGTLASLTIENCHTEPFEVVEAGTLSITHIEGTTNGTVTSRGAVVKVPSPIGKLTCRTNTGVDIGTLTGTGSSSNHAILHLNAVINCGFLLPSAEWKGEYIVTSPTGLGVSA